MPKDELLPGVTTLASPPAVVCASRAMVRAARRRAVLRDALQVAMLLAVDVLFAGWDVARLPFADRDGSLLIVAALNALVLTNLVVSRLFPRWSARRIASTWCPEERQRLDAALSRRRV